MIAKKSNSGLSQWLKAVSAIAVSGVVSGVMIAPAYAVSVPVVESQPVIRGAAIQTMPENNVFAVAPVTGGESESSGTAYVLNSIDQLRQEIMELRGQLEEQQFKINRLQQESRDRYLDLDDRMTRLNAGKTPALPTDQSSQPAEAVSSFKQSMVSAPVDIGTALNEEAEENEYQAAFKLIRERQFDEAKVALRQLLKNHPQGRYSDNALYWLGEVQMAQGKYPEAVKTFEQVLKDYPLGGKTADASYKLGRLHDLQGDQKKARDILESVIKNYPDSAAARLSDTYLRGM